TRPPASLPPASVSVSRNHGRWAGAFACVRSQMLNLPASALSCSMASRALTGAEGEGGGLATVDKGLPPDFSPCHLREWRREAPGGRPQARLCQSPHPDPPEDGEGEEALCADLAEIQPVLRCGLGGRPQRRRE